MKRTVLKLLLLMITAGVYGKTKKEMQKMNQNYLFFNIVPCTPGQEELQAQDVIELEAKTGISVALYSLTLHPEGYPATRKAEILLESYRRFAKALEGSKVKAGVLIQSILGHWPRVDKNEESWTRTVNIEGNPVRFCPLDAEYRKYIFNTIAALAKEKPCFFLGDDDIRSFSPHAECFCTLHTAEFNRRTGHNFSPEEYRLAVRASRPGDEVFTAYEKLRQDTVNGVASLIREAIDSVDSSIPAGSCMPGWEIRFNGYTAKAFAGKDHPALMRISNSIYMESTLLSLPNNHLRSMALRSFWKDIPVVLDEADTFPHSLFSKSARSMHQKLCSGIFAGVNGAKLWFVNTHNNGMPVNRKYTKILEKYRGFYSALASELQGSVPEGVHIPCHRNFPNWHPMDSLTEGITPAETWSESMLGIYGIPFDAALDLTQPGIYALSGAESVDRFTDEELTQLLKGKLLVDGPAAMKLTERGFAQYTGVKAEFVPFKFNREVSADGKRNYFISSTPMIPRLTLTDKSAEILTNLCYAAYTGATELETVAPGTVLFRNSLGGTVCTAAFHKSVYTGCRRDMRKVWLIRILEKLNGKSLDCVAAEYQPLMLLQRKAKDGRRIYGLFNLGFDPLETIELRHPGAVHSVKQMSPDGTWKELAFEKKGDILSLNTALECSEAAVLSIR